jgi:S-adenosylmethionine:tRNA-ribosyltransferase-isomerase (queuine synthetase)
MMVAERSSGCLTHTTFDTLPAFLEAGDLVVINTSAVVPAAVIAGPTTTTR